MKSLDSVRAYLLQDGTCKCGLNCPFDIERTFDFDCNVSIILQLVASAASRQILDAKF